MIELAIAAALLFALVCGGLALFHSAQVGRMTMLDWSLMAIGGMYGLGWAIVIVGTKTGVNPVWESWLLPHSNRFVLHTLLASALTFGVVLGWYVTGRCLARGPAPLRSVCHPSIWSWHLAFWLMLLLAVCLQWLYTRVYGGFFGILSYSADIRSGIFPVHNPFSFLSPFGGLSLISTLGFWGLWISGKRSFWLFLGMSVSFFFSLYVLYSWLGRMGFLVYIAAFPLGYVLARNRNPIKLLLFCVGGFASILLFAYGVSVWLSIKSAGSLLSFLSRELSFPFISLFAQLDVGAHLFLGFRDFVAAPLYLLPSSIWLQLVEPVGQINTAVIMGAPKGEAGVTGAIPVDVLTLGLMQLHVVGVPVVGALFGILIRVVQYLVDRIPFAGLRGVFHAYLALKVAVLAAFYAQPNQLVAGNFALIAGSLILIFCIRVGRIRVFDLVASGNKTGAPHR